jgi:tetratricopeptide (TPR) repeat protein
MMSNERIKKSSGNIFADLGLPDAETHFLKAQIVAEIYRLTNERKLTQVEAGKLMGISQPDVSRMFKGNFREYSVERLIAFLTALWVFPMAAPGWSGQAEEALNEGLKLHDAGKPKEAIREYDRALKANPKLADAYFNRGNAYYDLGQNDQAIKDYSEVIRLAPKDAEAYYNRGNAYRRLKRDEVALKDYTAAIKLSPEEAKNYVNRAALRCATPDAVNWQGHSYQPKDRPTTIIGQRLSGLRQNDEAIKTMIKRSAWFKAWRLITPRHRLLLLGAGKAIRVSASDPEQPKTPTTIIIEDGDAKQGKTEAAIEDYESIRLDPKDPEAPYTRSGLLRVEKCDMPPGLHEVIRIQPRT